MEKRIIITTAFTYGLFRATRLFIMVYGKLIRIVVLKFFLYKTVASDDFLNVCFGIELKFVQRYFEEVLSSTDTFIIWMVLPTTNIHSFNGEDNVYSFSNNLQV